MGSSSKAEDEAKGKKLANVIEAKVEAIQSPPESKIGKQKNGGNIGVRSATQLKNTIHEVPLPANDEEVEETSVAAFVIEKPCEDTSQVKDINEMKQKTEVPAYDTKANSTTNVELRDTSNTVEKNSNTD